ncbi:MAG: 23S rRNA (uracil(1939)-C(5))-methyltransferase RlmD [Selenomonadaceae bacterium]|nr:23S rRNA (uracil(1939)-C(5))-methyltransferase RlmD [Selenomonadaceae bacterium]MBR6888039.1 23S rRNA (uracil(1939)-C(5))-methyltransferase RlmD [Selenomonadaceae bacterium]
MPQLIKIHGLGSSGEGVGKVDNLAVFVEGALPGEEVLIGIETRKKNYAVGRLVEVVKNSPERVEPFCPLYKNCGGCQLQHMDYPAQLKWKRQQVVDAVERIGKLGGVKIFETLGMENPLRYRNKMQFPVGKNLQIGCYARGSHKIIDTTSCLIQNAGNDKILAAVRAVAKKFNLQPYDEDTHKGFLRHVMGRVGCNGELMIVLVTATKNFPNEKNFVRALLKEIPNVTSIQQNVQTFRNNVILGRDTKILYGKPTIHDKIGGLSFNISARSFFQVNTAQAEVLYKTAQDFAELRGNETVIDAYCGTGTISLFMAKKARKVIGVEVVSSAVADAKKNSRENNIRNAEFIVGDAVNVLPKIFDAGVYAEVVIVDPPRAGCDRKVLETFAAMKPEKIIYVSCNPATLARDLKILEELGWRTKKIQPVDMFPFTSHVESVAQIFKS